MGFACLFYFYEGQLVLVWGKFDLKGNYHRPEPLLILVLLILEMTVGAFAVFVLQSHVVLQNPCRKVEKPFHWHIDLYKYGVDNNVVCAYLRIALVALLMMVFCLPAHKDLNQRQVLTEGSVTFELRASFFSWTDYSWVCWKKWNGLSSTSLVQLCSFV